MSSSIAGLFQISQPALRECPLVNYFITTRQLFSYHGPSHAFSLGTHGYKPLIHHCVQLW